MYIICMSPTIFTSKSLQFRINTRNEHNPPHVHVVRADAEAVIVIKTGEVLFSDGFSPKALKEIREQVEHHREELLEAWNDYWR